MRHSLSRLIVITFALLSLVLIFRQLPSGWYTPLLPNPPQTKLYYSACCGSMYPTLPKNQSGVLDGYYFFPHPAKFSLYKYIPLNRGDIVTVTTPESSSASGSGLIKRLIALPHDTVEIRDGEVWVNDTPLKEPYTARARSTFGGTIVPECKKINLGDDEYFILGDNRKNSLDSRELGPIKATQIEKFMPYSFQLGKVDSLWHNAQNDIDDSAKITLDKTTYLELINVQRKAAGVPLYKYNSKLETAARLRGEAILRTGDFSYEATQSGLTQPQALAKAGYSNITWGEHVMIGYFEAQEMHDYDLQFPKLQKFIQDKDFQEIGIAEVRGELNGCPTQLIVRHFGGYVPPNYSQAVITSWEKALENLHHIQADWATLKNWGQFYENHKSEIDELNSAIAEDISVVTQIVDVVHQNRWIPENLTGRDKTLADRINQLADKINKYTE